MFNGNLNYRQLYIDGQWIDPSHTDTRAIINPATDSICGNVPAGNAQDVDRAVAAAKRAFTSWSQYSTQQRAGFLQAIADKIKQRAAQFSQIISLELGAPAKIADAIHVGLPLSILASYVKLAELLDKEETIGHSRIVKEPIGVCGFITPWNYPLHQIICKVAPALAAGCTMVLKPSDQTPLSAFLLAEVMHDVGLPPGVFNLVSGKGAVVGEAIAKHPDIALVSITGSTASGVRVAELAAASLKRVCQELGGKSANIILDDADFTKAIKANIYDLATNSGQTCSALTRMFVPRQRQDEVATMAAQFAANIKIGFPDESDVRMGPLVSQRQRESVIQYIQAGIDEGATLVCGGVELPAGFTTGAFVQFTIFSNVSNAMSIAQEEIFGPVLCIIPYDTEAEAIAMANDSIYGLSGAVWSGEKERAIAVARQLRTGQVAINGGKFNPQAPFGGYKHSGNGREMGVHGLNEFLEIKALHL